MLKTMRKNVKALAPTLWIVIATFIISIFAIWGGAGRLGEKAQEDTIAFLGKDRIATESYYQVLRNRLEAMQKEFRTLNKSFIQQLNIPQQVLEQMVQQRLLLRRAREMGISASNQEIRDRIVSLFQRDGKFIGYDEYRRILDYNRMSISEFEDSLKEEIVLNKVIQVLTAGLTATPEELWENYRKQTESAKIEYLLLEESKVPFEQELQAADVQAYFEKNKERYSLPERRQGSYVFVQTEELKKEVEVSEADIEKYYRDNLDQFKEPGKAKVGRVFLSAADKDPAVLQQEAAAILDRLKAGTDFAQVARASSQDEKAKDGGDWGYDEWRRLPSKEREEVEKLSSGQLSGVIETTDGLAVLKVVEKNPERTPTVGEVTTRIRGILEDQKARDLAAQRIGQLEKSARREKSLDVGAQKIDLKIRNTGLLKQGQALESFDPGGSIAQALFELKDREISSPIYTFTGTGIVQLETVEAPRPATFEEVRLDVEKDFRTTKQKEITLQKIQEARAKVDGKNWDEMASQLGLEYKSVAEHKREQYLGVIGESPEIDRLSFSLPLNQTSDPIDFASGYALLRVLERKEVDAEEFEKNKQAELTNYLETKKNRFLQAYIGKLREEKEVKINYNLLMQINNDILSRYEARE
ncbi:MAG: SurA N-terminal domain-containing protein [Candidatus Aminicenantes bacterium]|nr:SurA N-terminal domain-containing protein [Candidatus Aminicenantes bacterium]